jgi:hypothetical protein
MYLRSDARADHARRSAMSMRRLISMLWCCSAALAACSSVDVIGSFLPRPPRDAGVDGPSTYDASLTATPASTLPDVTPTSVRQSPLQAGAAADDVRRDASMPLDAGTPMTPPPAIDGLCLRSGLDPMVCQTTRALAFGHAVCGCSDMLGTGSLSTETLGDATGRAAVGSNQSFTLRIGRRAANQETSGAIDGALVIGGPGPAPISGNAAEIRGPLELAGDLTFAGDVHVSGAAYSRDLPRGNGTLAIDGNLYHYGQRSTLPANVTVGGDVIEDDYVTAPPCACGPLSAPEVAALIAAADSGNDDARAQLSADSLSQLTAAHSVKLDCGHYYFSNVSSLGSLELQVSGQALMVVAGDFMVRGDVSVALAPNAELDLLIGGNLSLSGAARFGDPARPSASRIYVKGGVELTTAADLPALSRPSSAAGDALFVGNLYAPAATLQLTPNTDVYGSLFVKQLVVLQSLLVHYDPSVTIPRGASCGQ